MVKRQFLPKTLGIKNTASGRLTAEEIDDLIEVKLPKLQRKAKIKEDNYEQRFNYIANRQAKYSK